MAEKDSFEYTYSASERSEIQTIREKYQPREMTKLEQLRALDESVTKRGTAVSITHGVIFSLIMGFGMSCCMVWAERLFLPGIAIGCIGISGVAGTYPIYHHIVKKDKEKIAPEILRLSDELIAGNGN